MFKYSSPGRNIRGANVQEDVLQGTLSPEPRCKHQMLFGSRKIAKVLRTECWAYCLMLLVVNPFTKFRRAGILLATNT